MPPPTALCPMQHTPACCLSCCMPTRFTTSMRTHTPFYLHMHCLFLVLTSAYAQRHLQRVFHLWRACALRCAPPRLVGIVDVAHRGLTAGADGLAHNLNTFGFCFPYLAYLHLWIYGQLPMGGYTGMGHPGSRTPAPAGDFLPSMQPACSASQTWDLQPFSSLVSILCLCSASHYIPPTLKQCISHRAWDSCVLCYK